MSENNTIPQKSESKINKAVFYTSALLIFLLVAFAAIFPDVADKNFKLLQQQIFTNASWFYILAVALILLSVTFLGLSRYGDIKLGPDHAQPDFSYHSWFAMLFSAGMGIGLMFFGVAEPVMHYLSPPVGTPETVTAAKEAMRLTFFHWGLHAWAIYAIVALILAFFSYRHGLPLTLRSALYPIIGDKIHGPIGHAVDIFAVIGTVFGVATSLGYGVLQVNAGLNHLFGVPINETVQVILIVVITGLATISVVSGLDKGIRILSELNLGLALLLLALVLCLGPTVLLLKSFVENTGGYLSELVSKTFNLYAYEPKSSNWLGGWTLLYWGWWLSWSPFVGMFIARVSRGRTIREFVTGVLFVPAGFTLMWMTVFGNSAINLIMREGATDLANTVQQDVALALFNFLEHFPFSSVLSFIAMAMVIVFFVTSADLGDGGGYAGIRRRGQYSRLAAHFLGRADGRGGDCAAARGWVKRAANRHHRQRVTVFHHPADFHLRAAQSAASGFNQTREPEHGDDCADRGPQSYSVAASFTQHCLSAKTIAGETLYGRSHQTGDDPRAGGVEQAGHGEPNQRCLRRSYSS